MDRDAAGDREREDVRCGKTIASAGIVRQHIHARVPAPDGRNSVMLPAEFMICTAQRVSIAENQLLRRRRKHDHRQFRAITEGVALTGRTY